MQNLLPTVEMPAELQRLYDQFLGELETLRGEETLLVEAERGITLSVQVLDELRDWVEKHPFDSTRAEIQFFKHIKPRFYCRLLFYQHLYLLESRKPTDSPKSLRKYYKRKLWVIRDFFEEHHDLYVYLRRKEIHLDHTYFLRSSPDVWRPVEAVRVDSDKEFSTLLDFRVAEILKNELMAAFLLEKLAKSRVSPGTVPLSGSTSPKFQWTGPLKGLNQVIRSFVKAGAVNNGNVTMSELAEFFEFHFNVNLKNMYRATQEDRISKEPGAYMKLLWQKLLEDYNDSDEHPRGR